MLVVAIFTGTYSDGFFENRENSLFGKSPMVSTLKELTTKPTQLLF